LAIYFNIIVVSRLCPRLISFSRITFAAPDQVRVGPSHFVQAFGDQPLSHFFGALQVFDAVVAGIWASH
jgi:hypothetical protein